MTCEVHPGVSWGMVVWGGRTASTMPCFVCEPEAWAGIEAVENGHSRMVEAVYDIFREFSPLWLDTQAAACQLHPTPTAPTEGATTAKEATA